MVFKLVWIDIFTYKSVIELCFINPLWGYRIFCIPSFQIVPYIQKYRSSFPKNELHNDLLNLKLKFFTYARFLQARLTIFKSYSYRLPEGPPETISRYGCILLLSCFMRSWTYQNQSPIFLFQHLIIINSFRWSSIFSDLHKKSS